MNEHPYYTVLTIATALITIGALVFLGLLCGWANTKWAAAREMRAWARSTRIDWDAEHEQLLDGPERP